MSNSIPERIVLELIDRLEAITIGNGYAMTASVYRVNRDAANGWSPKHYDIVVVQGDDERLTEWDCPGNPAAIGYELPIQIMAFVRLSDRTTTPEQQVVNNFAASIRKAIAVDHAWYTFGDVSRNADIGTAAFFRAEDGSHAGATLTITVQYRVSELDPFEVR